MDGSTRANGEIPFVAVVGLHSSGSSCLAGVLHHLGVHLGNRLRGHYGSDPQTSCGFEARALATLCQRAIRFPTTNWAQESSTIRRSLKQWISGRQREAFKRDTIAGGKHPHFCRLGDELMAACGPPLMIVHSNRPIAESIESLLRRSGMRHSRAAHIAHQMWLWDGKTIILGKWPHCTVNYHDLLAKPDKQIERIVHFLGINPSEECMTRAATYVKPDRQHVFSDTRSTSCSVQAANFNTKVHE